MKDTFIYYRLVCESYRSGHVAHRLEDLRGEFRSRAARETGWSEEYTEDFFLALAENWDLTEVGVQQAVEVGKDPAA